jgi:hypothetical protein
LRTSSGLDVIEVPLLDDQADEGNESLRVLLYVPAGDVTLDPMAREAEVVILDDDRERGDCVSERNVLCLQDGRFEVEVVWFTGSGASGRAVAVPDSQRAGLFWFFERSNVEMLFKVLDGCNVAGLESWWVFYSATTDLGFRVSVTDTRTFESITCAPVAAELPVDDPEVGPVDDLALDQIELERLLEAIAGIARPSQALQHEPQGC